MKTITIAHAEHLELLEKQISRAQRLGSAYSL